MNITLPARLKEFVETRVKDGDYADPSDVVREALRFRIAASGHTAGLGRRDAEASAVLGAISGGGDADIEAVLLTVMMQAAESAREDLKMIVAEVKAANAAKAQLRELIKRVARDATKNAGAKRPDGALEFSTGLGSERAYHVAPMPIADAASPSGVTLVETDLHAGEITSVDQIQAVLDDLKARLDSMSELQEITALRLQMYMDRRSKFISTLSNLMKKISETQAALVNNLK